MSNSNIRDMGITALHCDVRQSCIKIIRILLKRLNIVDNSCGTSFNNSALKPYLDNVEHFLKKTKNVEALDWVYETPVDEDIEKKYAKCVRILIKIGAKVDDIDNTGKTLLHYAVSHTNIVYHLLKYGSPVNALDISFKTPLYYAVENLHADTVKLLLRFGADLNIKYLDKTILHVAVQKLNVDIVKLILNYGADVDALDSLHCTPLHYAVRKYRSGIFKLPLQCGANENALDCLGKTPLHHSLSVNKPDISVIQTLIKYGADVNAVNRDGQNVLDVAVCNQATTYTIFKLILQNGAIIDFDRSRNILVNINQQNRYCLAELLIQYFILRKAANPEIQVYDQFRTVLLAHIAEDMDNYEYFLSVGRSCIIEVLNMRNEFIYNEQTLFQLVFENSSRTTSLDQNVDPHVIDTLFLLLENGKYVQYRALIYACIKRSILVKRLCQLEVCCQVADSDILTLNYDCINNLTKYISKDDVINMSIVFDKFEDYEFPSTCTPKRSTELNKGNVFKKLRK